MKLVSFSVENYRSITKAKKIPLQDYTLLIGPNNEGKSNILHALILAMNALIRFPEQITMTKDGRIIRRRNRPDWRSISSDLLYEWERDYPISLQKKSRAGVSNVILDFELTQDEISEFKDEIASNLNGTLPIQISLGVDGIQISIQKQGRGHATLNKKSNRIATFVSKRISFEYIPAIRTSKATEEVIIRLIEKELRKLGIDESYRRALEALQALENPIFTDLVDQF